MSDRQVVITGIGAVTPYGLGADTFWQKLVQGSSAASPITTFDASRFPTTFAAQAPVTDDELDGLIENQKSAKTMSRAIKFAVVAAQEAVTSAALDTTQMNPYRLGTSLGVGGLGLWDLDYATRVLDIAQRSIEENEGRADYGAIWQATLERLHPLTPLKGLPNMAAAHIAINTNARGVCQTNATACTSSAQAIGEAYRYIKTGLADVMIAGGSDSMVNPNGIIAFSMVGVMTRNNEEYKTAARPFDKRRDGFMLGEGAAIFVLEELEHCKQRGAVPYGELLGYANTCDAFRLTDEPPEAWGSIEAMRQALADAGVGAETVDYINAHGTGTPMNDSTETLAIKTVFGEHAYSIPVSSTKSMIGHLVAAAGAVEFAACVQALRRHVIPPTINYQVPDPDCDLDYVPNEARETRLDTILSNSFGFGGQNACLIIKRV